MFFLPASRHSNTQAHKHTHTHTHTHERRYRREKWGLQGLMYKIKPAENNGASVSGGFQILHSTTAQVT